MPAGLGHVVPLGEWQRKAAMSGSAHGGEGVLLPSAPPCGRMERQLRFIDFSPGRRLVGAFSFSFLLSAIFSSLASASLFAPWTGKSIEGGAVRLSDHADDCMRARPPSATRRRFSVVAVNLLADLESVSGSVHPNDLGSRAIVHKRAVRAEFSGG